MNSIYDIFKIFSHIFRLAFRLIKVNRKIMLKKTLRSGASHIFCLKILIFRRVRYCYYIVSVGSPDGLCLLYYMIFFLSEVCG